MQASISRRRQIYFHHKKWIITGTLEKTDNATQIKVLFLASGKPHYANIGFFHQWISSMFVGNHSPQHFEEWLQLRLEEAPWLDDPADAQAAFVPNYRADRSHQRARGAAVHAIDPIQIHHSPTLQADGRHQGPKRRLKDRTKVPAEYHLARQKNWCSSRGHLHCRQRWKKAPNRRGC